MQIRRIEVRDFRKLGHALVENLQDGLNVVVGDNEAGKSTLLAALRAALFERHRVGGEVAQGMLPYNQSVRPEVSVDFELDGRAWQLRKAFCQRPEAELRGPGERTTGDAVEERLMELFGFRPPLKGRSKPEEHQGVYGLLWVEQGASHRALGVGASRGAIASALEQEVGQVVGGERGRVLLACAEERRNRFWDKRGSTPRGSYKALGDEVAELAAREVDLRTKLAAYDDQVARLETKNEGLARHERDKRLDAATAAVAAARQAASASEHLRSALAATADALARRRLEHATASERASARTKLIDEARRAREAAAAAAVELGEDEVAAARTDELCRQAELASLVARSRARETWQALRDLEQARGRAEAIAVLAAMKERLGLARGVESQRQAYIAAAAAIVLKAEDLAAIEALQADLDRARLQLEAASVRIIFEPDGGQGVGLDGQVVLAAEPLRLSRDAVLTLGGFGRITVRPGGGVGALAAKCEHAARALADRLIERGVSDVAAARTMLTRKAEARREAEIAGRTLAGLAPQGLDILSQAVSDRRATLARDGGEGAFAPEWTQAQLDEQSRAQMVAAAGERAAADDLARSARAKQAAALAVATLAERAASASRHQAALSQLLAMTRADVTDDELEARLGTAQQAVEQAAHVHATAEAALVQTSPEAIALELQRAERAERAIRDDLDALRRAKRDIEVELRALGRDGLGEQLAETAERLVASQRRLEAQGAEARAARLLQETLAQAQRETRDRWLGPVRERAAPYLRLIQPDSDITLNEGTLEIEGLVRKGVSEPFSGLSVGAREQVAVITRLALAEILNGAKRPSAIILDDALVNTDEERLRRMHLVLQRAGRSMQILILTCREQDFVQLGAPLKRL